MENLFLGVDTSNDTTSLALCTQGGIVRQVRRLLPVKNGECGLRQSDAVFLHTKALPELAVELFDNSIYSPNALAGVGVSAFPRDVKGSYMPCFLAGISFASAVAFSHGIPLRRFSHQAGHIMAGIAFSGAPDVFEGEFLSFHISGGTTEALRVKRTQTSFTCEIVGGSKDASAGQIIDRAGVLAGLDFPCGKALDNLAKSAQKTLPVCISSDGAYFSLSGLQNRFEKYLSSGETLADSAAFLFESIAGALSRAVDALRKNYGHSLPVLFAGGVMSNSRIRARLAGKHNVYFATPELSSDNACGTALLCELASRQEEPAYHRTETEENA